MNKKLFGYAMSFFAVFGGSLVMAGNDVSREIRTYMPFAVPIDPARIDTTVDIDISYALASTLTELDEDGAPRAGLAGSWEATAEKSISFRLRENGRWSNGERIDAHEVVKSFERAKSVHGSQLQGLFSLVEKISAISTDILEFRLKVPVNGSGILLKLTEPMYGIVKITHGNDINLKISSGPFYLKNETKNEIKFSLNTNWFGRHANMAEQITIRQKSDDIDLQNILLTDPWPNITTTSSLMNKQQFEHYKVSSYEMWQRNLDRIFLFSLGKRIANDDGFQFLKYLSKHLNRVGLAKNFSGLTLAQQMYPRGTSLYDEDFKCAPSRIALPSVFKTRPLDIVVSPMRVSPALETNIISVIEEITGIAPHIIRIPLDQIGSRRKIGDYDFYAGSFGADDANLDGALSYFIEGEASIIPSSGNSDENFVKRLNDTRNISNQSQKIKLMRSIVSDATCSGHVLPLFHYSTIAVANGGLDLSSVPTTDETVSFSKVKFK